jgi:sialidase-1
MKTRNIFIGLLTLVISGMSASVLIAQSLEPNDIFISGTEGVHEFRIPAMITLSSGTVITACDARVDRKGDVPNNIDQMVKRSTDNGKTWGKIITAVNFANQEGAGDPSLIQDAKTGRVFLFYTYCPGRNDVPEGGNAKQRHLSLQYVFSDDEGITWSIPQVVEHGLKKEGWHSMWPGPGRGTVLSDERLIVPITVFDFEHMYSYYIYSDDHGNSWDISGMIGMDVNEPTLVEIDENKLLVNARNTNRDGKRAIVTSEDRGKTWSEISYHEDLPDPTCQGSCIRIKDKKGKNILIFSNAADPKKRQNMTVTISYDNGKSWPMKRTVYEGPSAYSCLTVLQDGEIGLFYENGIESPYEKISFVKFPLDWVSDKR